MDESGEDRDRSSGRRDGWAEIDVPTLVLPADHDPPWHERMCEALAEGIRSCHGGSWSAGSTRVRNIDLAQPAAGGSIPVSPLSSIVSSCRL